MAESDDTFEMEEEIEIESEVEETEVSESGEWPPSFLKYSDSNGGKTMWAERRLAQNGKGLKYLVLESSKPINELNADWKDFLELATECGFYIECKTPKRVYKMRSKAVPNQPVKEFPHDVSFF